MSDGWEITTKAKTKYVLEWEEIKYNSQREETYNSVSKKLKEFATFNELHEYYLKFEHNKGVRNIIGYKMEWLDLDKKINLMDIDNEN